MPTDLEKLEADARSTATKHVANMLQRPDQLEKVDQQRRRCARKKASIEAMLKTAVQSQLDGVKTGLSQLNTALQDVKEIKTSLESIEENYKSIKGLPDVLDAIKDENARHSQLAAASENLKNIFTVPELVKKTQGHINDGKLLHAHKSLMDLESSRNDLFYELHKQPKQSPTDKNTLTTYFADVQKLSDSLAKQLWMILQRLIVTVRSDPAVIVNVVRIIEREERLDQMWLKKEEQTGFKPKDRPKRWKDKCFEVLQGAVAVRIEANQADDRSDDKMWLVKHLEITRQLVLQDLKMIKGLCPTRFPKEYDIVNRYVKMYHDSISQHLLDLIGQELEGNEIVSLMSWLNTYKSHEMMGFPELDIDVDTLGPLLEPEVLEHLQSQYLNTMRGNFSDWMSNSLKSDIKDWFAEHEPEADSERYFNTPLPVILFQIVQQNIQVASHINDELVNRVLDLCIEEMEVFANSYKAELHKFKEQYIRNRDQQIYFLQYMMACINNCQVMAECMIRLRDQYRTGDIDTTKEKDNFDGIAETYNTIAETGCRYLLEIVFMDMQKFLLKFFSREWLLDEGSTSVHTICMTMEDYCGDFVHLKPKYYTYLLYQAEERVLLDYFTALFAKKIQFKTYDERINAAEKICKESEQIKIVFRRLSPKASSEEQSPWDVLPSLAEILRLRDTALLSLELADLIHRYPDIKQDQLLNLVTMRGDINVKEAKQVISEVMGEENEENLAKPRGIFSRIFDRGQD